MKRQERVTFQGQTPEGQVDGLIDPKRDSKESNCLPSTKSKQLNVLRKSSYTSSTAQ